ncbi:Unknown protein [Striga hermonthica]|uniref:DUF4283 domain-containing protein n=1 Tax=Striga hermonthica TaxID=68872 RepID=A0A9N7NLX9_STRHE|nr:Unknown protein [Striga hermonthica]
MAQDLEEKFLKFGLSEKEEEGLEIADADVAPTVSECKLSLLGKVYGDKKANFYGLKTTLGSIWTTKHPFTIKSLGDNIFQFLFQIEEDRDKILTSKTWSFDGQYILLKQWVPGDTVFKEADEYIKIWVQIHNMPLHWISASTGLKIGRLIGLPLDVQLPGPFSHQGNLLKVLVKIPLKGPILGGSKIKLGNENKWADFRYESLQSFYFYCGHLGHSDKNCMTKKEDVLKYSLNLGQYGEWLRVSPLNISGFWSSSGPQTESKSSDRRSDREEVNDQEGNGVGGRSQGSPLALVNFVKPTGVGLDKVGSSIDESSLRSPGGKHSNSLQSLETIPEESKLVPSKLVEVDIQHGSIGARVSQRKQKKLLKEKQGWGKNL